MLIINADDWGRCVEETDAALKCFREKRVTSVSAMMFMADSERAARLALEHGVDVGLHLNFAEPFAVGSPDSALHLAQGRLVRYLMGKRYAQLVFNPFLSREFAVSLAAQLTEFERLYKKPPSHIDGHHHMHLCGNMVFGGLLPAGTKIRRNFSFWPGEKSALNRAYRTTVDRWMRRHHRMTDYFFDLRQCLTENKLNRVASLARSRDVELMSHPILVEEISFLLGQEFVDFTRGLRTGSYEVL